MRIKPQIVSVEMITSTPVNILRFIDQIDYALWAGTYTEDIILDSIGTCFASKYSDSWYNALVNSKWPRKLTIHEIKRALMKDFGVENWEAILMRYGPEDYRAGEGIGYEYYQTQEFKLRLSYLDEIESLKDQIKFRDKRALEDGKKMKEMEGVWESVVSNKNRRIQQLETTARERERQTRDLSDDVKERGRAVIPLSVPEKAFQTFEKSIEEARDRLRKDLGIHSYQGLSENMKIYPIESLSPAKTSFQTRRPQVKTVHWPSSSSLEKMFETPPIPSSPQSPRKRFFIRSPLKTFSKNANPKPFSLSTLAITRDGTVRSPECDDLLNDWNKELVLNARGKPSLRPIL